MVSLVKVDILIMFIKFEWDSQEALIASGMLEVRLVFLLCNQMLD